MGTNREKVGAIMARKKKYDRPSGVFYLILFLILLILCSFFAAKSSMTYDDSERITAESELIEDLQN